MKNVWFSSDHHFGHANVIKHANRPFADVEEMDSEMIRRWNALVNPKDDVYYLGDFSFHKADKTLQILNQLKGNIFYIKGNHDKNFNAAIKERFEWTKDYAEVDVNGQKIILCHYAFRVWNKSHYGSWNLYGHSHGTLLDDPNLLSMDVGVDNHAYAPISFDEIVSLMARKEWKPVDHHGRVYSYV